MQVRISVCKWEDISFIPQQYDTEHAQFAKRKKPEIWFKVDTDVSENYAQIIGTGCLLILSKTRVRLSNVFVIPEYRGKGIAKKIVKAREDYAKIHGYKIIDTRTVKKYYEALGYKVIKDYKVGGSWLEKVIG